MEKHFVFAEETRPGDAWAARFAAGRDETQRWYLGQGLADPPTAAQCRAALVRHMPELVPEYDRACRLVGDDDLAYRILSHYRPPPLSHGCSQAVWLGAGGPALVRNYDFPLEIVSDRFEMSGWLGRRIIAKAQRPWGGVIDGMNEDGLVASLTYGGSKAQSLGFSIILLLRYVLETCRRVDEAVAALARIPVALSQNVTVLDRTGATATLFLGPDRAPAVTTHRVCTNHQEVPDPLDHADSIRRHRLLETALADPTTTLESLTARFFEPPLLSRRRASTTVYTAVYRLAEGRVDYRWPGTCRSQSFARFEPSDHVEDYGALTEGNADAS